LDCCNCILSNSDTTSIAEVREEREEV
jgi:hypothetical protein